MQVTFAWLTEIGIVVNVRKRTAGCWLLGAMGNGMLSDALLATVRHVWRTLEPAGVRMAVIGGLALSVWEHLRATKDADLLVGVAPENIQAVLDILRKAGIRPTQDPPLVDVGTARILPMEFEPPDAYIDIRIDLLIAESEFHRAALDRSISVTLPESDLSIRVVSCEDLILFKLLAGRIIDQSDVAHLLRYNRDSLDLPYLWSQSSQMNLDRDLSLIWQEAFPGESLPDRPS